MTTWLQLARELYAFVHRPILNSLEVIMSDLSNARDIMTANSAKLDKISGEVQGIKATNDELLVRIQELQSQQPDNQAVADILALARAEQTKLGAIDEMIPDIGTPEQPA